MTTGLQRWRAPQLQAALVAIDPQTGDVLALVGGRDFGRSQFNRAVNARRQPGSAFKPVLYAAALESGMSPVSVVSGLNQLHVPGHDEWIVKNATADTRDALTLREALYESNNQAAVRLQTQVGSRPVLSLAKSLGLPDLPDVPSLALGVGEVTPLALTAAYAAFPNGGFAVTPRPIVTVLDPDGYAVFRRDVNRRQVMSDATAFQMVSMLEDVLDTGTGEAARSLGVRFPAAGKTGTTDEFKDAWFVGFSSGVVAGVWVGLDQPAPIAPDAFGARYALPIWADFMSHVARTRPPQPFQPPSSVQRVALCRVSHLLPTELCPTYSEYFKSRRRGSHRHLPHPPRAGAHGRASDRRISVRIGQQHRVHLRQTLTSPRIRLSLFPREVCGAEQRLLNVRADIRIADVLVEIGPPHQLRRLLAGAAQDQRAAGFFQAVRQIFERLQARGIHRRHVPQPHNDNRRQRLEMVADSRQLVGRAEQKRPVNAVQRHVARARWPPAANARARPR